MKHSYDMTIGNVKRELPLCKINDNTQIAAFVIFGDVELTCESAKQLLEIAPEYDIMITAESKGIPLIHEMARQSGQNEYIVARKVPKLYMKDVFSVKLKSITTEKEQFLCIDSVDCDKMRGKRVLIIDDVISTGESIKAVELLVEKSGGIVAGKMAILAEGCAKNREDIKYLEYLPLFDNYGNPLSE